MMSGEACRDGCVEAGPVTAVPSRTKCHGRIRSSG
jgi:hypothetical protein